MRQYNIKKKNNKIYGFPILDAENAKALLYKRNKEMNDEQIKSYEKLLESTKKAKLYYTRFQNKNQTECKSKIRRRSHIKRLENL